MLHRGAIGILGPVEWFAATPDTPLRGVLHFSDDDALRWITSNPAWALGIDDQVGSLEVGKRADVVMTDGDLLEPTSRVLLVMDNLFSGDDALALAEAARIETPTEAWGSYFRALALMGLGYREQALDEMEAALAIDPTVLDDLESVVKSSVQLTTAQRHVLAERLRMFTADV